MCHCTKIHCLSFSERKLCPFAFVPTSHLSILPLLFLMSKDYSLCSIGYVWTYLHIFFFLAQTRPWLEWNGHHNRMKTGSRHQNRMQVHIGIKALQALLCAENICRCCPREHELAVALCFLQISWSQQTIYAATRSQVTISLTASLNYTADSAALCGADFKVNPENLTYIFYHYKMPFNEILMWRRRLTLRYLMLLILFKGFSIWLLFWSSHLFHMRVI